MTARNRIEDALSSGALCDDCPSSVARVSPRQQVNQIARALRDTGKLERIDSNCRSCGKHKILNHLCGKIPAAVPAASRPVLAQSSEFGEDAVKRVLDRHLTSLGWVVSVAWAKQRGIDLDARKDGNRWIIEVKGPGSLQPMRVNYFIGILGETLQRMSDDRAKYSIAFPDHPQYRGLWERLPPLAKRRTGITMLLVRPDGAVEELI